MDVRHLVGAGVQLESHDTGQAVRSDDGEVEDLVLGLDGTGDVAAVVVDVVEAGADEAVPAAGRPDQPVPEAFASLSPRELDTVRYIALGLSNAEIASRMFVSEPTVKTHVTAVLSKLGLRDRVQVVVRCYETGFVRPGDAGLS